MNGILLIDKPQGITSHDVVARCRKALGVRRIGHAGTLDPMATGLLVLGVGRATRLLRFLEAHDKTYEAQAVFGAATSTQDAEGEMLDEHDASGLERGAVEQALEGFRGEIEQVPPMMSAVKIDGERLWRKARRGEEVERPARRVRVYELTLTGFEPGVRARAGLHVRCSRGTYVRTIAADLGEAIGVGAHLGALRRTAIGPFAVAGAARLEDAGPQSLGPMAVAVTGYPRRDIDAGGALLLVQGKPLDAAGIDGPYAVFGPEGLVAMVEDRGGEARSLCVVAEP